MDIAKDIVEKYPIERVIDYLDKLSAGVLQNYRTAIKVNQPEVLFGDLGDIAQIHAILREMKKRNQEKEALKNPS